VLISLALNDDAVNAAERAATLQPTNNACWHLLGVAQYRAEEWEASIVSLAKAEELAPNNTLAFNGFFLAMAHWQLGHKDEARELYDRSVAWMEKNQPKNEELIRFRAEAEQLMGIAKPAAAPPNAP
jgi:Flp pilus assembly protein TadD